MCLAELIWIVPPVFCGELKDRRVCGEFDDNCLRSGVVLARTGGDILWVHMRSDSLISGEGNEHIIYKLLILRCLRPTPNEVLGKEK